MTRRLVDQSFSSRCHPACVAAVRGQADDRYGSPRGRVHVVVRLRLQAIGCDGRQRGGLWRRSIITERKRSSGQ
jgi:hypothetical protein